MGLHSRRGTYHPEKIVNGVGDARLGVHDGDVDVAVHLRPRCRFRHDLQRDASVLGAEVAQDRDREAVGEEVGSATLSTRFGRPFSLMTSPSA